LIIKKSNVLVGLVESTACVRKEWVVDVVPVLRTDHRGCLPSLKIVIDVLVIRDAATSSVLVVIVGVRSLNTPPPRLVSHGARRVTESQKLVVHTSGRLCCGGLAIRKWRNQWFQL
jgi:hypothetical protein